jgi:hypothetical protein
MSDTTTYVSDHGSNNAAVKGYWDCQVSCACNAVGSVSGHVTSIRKIGNLPRTILGQEKYKRCEGSVDDKRE